MLLLSSAYGLQIGLSPMKSMFIGPRCWKGQLKKAKQLAPDNPRVVLSAAISDFNTPKMFGGSKEKGLQGFQRAAELLAQEKPTDPIQPVWGHSEARTLGSASLTKTEVNWSRRERPLKRRLNSIQILVGSSTCCCPNWKKPIHQMRREQTTHQTAELCCEERLTGFEGGSAASGPSPAAPASLAIAFGADVVQIGRSAFPMRVDGVGVEQALEVAEVVVSDQGQGLALPAHASGPARAVGVDVGVKREIVVDDVGDVRKIEAAPGHVRGDHKADLLLAETAEDGGASLLV